MRKPTAFPSALIATTLFAVAPTTSALSFASADSLSVRADSVLRQDTTAVSKWVSLTNAFASTTDSIDILTHDDLHWLDHRFLGEILTSIPGVYLRDQNSAGQYSQINVRGTDWRGIGITMDGRMMNDPASGIYHPSYFTTDYLDHLEVVTGPRAFVYGLNAAGAAINLVSKHFDSNHPFSKINYSESAHGYSVVDGTVAQNITSALGIGLGFQRQITDGRFANSSHDAWNLRAKIRYHVSDRMAIILSEYLTATHTQLNGGISPDGLPDAFFPLEAQVRNGDSYEKVNRNDVDLSVLGRFFDDSTNVTRLSLYYSNNFREYRDEHGSDIPNSLFIQSDHTSSWAGATFTQKLDGTFHRLFLGSNIELRQIEGSPNLGRQRDVIGSILGTEDLFPTDWLTIGAFGRYDQYLGDGYLGIGGEVTTTFIENLAFFTGGSFSRRLPTYQELYWTDSTVSRTGKLVAEEHTHFELGCEFRLPNRSSIRASVFHKRIVHPLITLPFGNGFVFPGVAFQNGGELITKGFETRLNLRVWSLAVEGVGNLIFQESAGTSLEEYPDVWGNLGIYFRDDLFDGHLRLKTGFKATYQSSQLGTEFNPEVIAFAKNTTHLIDAGGKIDFLLIGHIGDAYIHFIWENLTDAEYFATPFYPGLDRAIRFGISWELMD